MGTAKHIKPLARAKRVPLARQRTGVSFSREAEEILFRDADILSEGGCGRGRGRRAREDDRYFGSTMITVDLEKLAPKLRIDLLDEQMLLSMVRMVQGSVRLRLRATRLAYAEALRKIPGRRFGTATIETRVQLQKKHLLLDVEFEAPVEAADVRRKTKS